MRGKYGIDSDLRYFTELFLVCAIPGWNVCVGTSKPPEDYAGAVVKHLETGHIWVINDEPPEQWGNQKIYLGRWPD
jgi:hypothetical protein